MTTRCRPSLFAIIESLDALPIVRDSHTAAVDWHLTPQLVYTSDSDAQEHTMTQGTVQLVAGVLAVVLIGIVILRRKGNKKKEEDDF
jgi:hypothetical protein